MEGKKKGGWRELKGGRKKGKAGRGLREEGCFGLLGWQRSEQTVRQSGGSRWRRETVRGNWRDRRRDGGKRQEKEREKMGS